LVPSNSNLGNNISYTLDAAGNRTQTKITDPNGALARQQNQLFDQLGRLQQVIGMAGQTVNYEYDALGNLTKISDVQNRVTLNQYDPLNRLIKQTNPLGGVTQYGYDLLGQLTSVTDPRSLTTSYTVDGLGNRTRCKARIPARPAMATTQPAICFKKPMPGVRPHSTAMICSAVPPRSSTQIKPSPMAGIRRSRASLAKAATTAAPAATATTPWSG